MEFAGFLLNEEELIGSGRWVGVVKNSAAAPAPAPVPASALARAASAAPAAAVVAKFTLDAQRNVAAARSQERVKEAHAAFENCLKSLPS